jgi:integrase
VEKIEHAVKENASYAELGRRAIRHGATGLAGGVVGGFLASASSLTEVSSAALLGGAGGPLIRSQKKGEGGEPRAITARQAERIVKGTAKKAGLTNASDVSPHWLRHAHASHAMDRGAKIHLVQATLGHSDISTTGRYLHTRPDESSALDLGS